MLSLLYGPTLTFIHDYWKTIALTIQMLVGKVMSLLLNMLSRFVITFLPRSKHLLISWLQSLFAVILDPNTIKSVTVFIFSPIYLPWASLVAQIVKNLSAMQNTWVWSLDWEDRLKREMSTHSSILAWNYSMDKGAWWAMRSIASWWSMRLQRVGHDWVTNT